MTRTPAEAAGWFRSGVARTIKGGDWEGGCVAAVFTAGAFGHSYDYAVQAAVAAGATYAGGRALPATGRLNPRAEEAGDGSQHYWGGIWNSAFNRWDGHIGTQYGGLIYMASSYARREYGNHLGASTWAEYSADRGLPYLGHSPYFGNQLLAGVNPAALNVNPLNPAPQEEDDMIEDPAHVLLRYTSSTPNEFILANLEDKTYRVVVPGSWEDQYLNAKVADGSLKMWTMFDPIWGATFGNGQYRNVDTVEVGSGATNTQAIIDAVKSGDQAILTAVANQPEATLAAFGLKRA